MINGWRFQKDRSNIDDGFRAGDLKRLFNESKVQDKIIDYGELKRQEKAAQYGKVRNWRFQKDRSHIDDSFEAGDLECLFDESQVRECFTGD